MTVAADWERIFAASVQRLVPWLLPPVFVPRADGMNKANIVGIAPLVIAPPLAGPAPLTVAGPVGAPVVAFPPQSPVDDDFVAHESGHAAHEVAAHARDLVEHKGTAGTDIYAEVAAILSPGTVWPSAGPDLRDEWTAEAFRKAVTGNVGQLRYPNPPGQISPYPLEALRAYFATMNKPRAAALPPPPPPPPVPAPVALPAVADVYYSQWDADHVGQGDCVPTSAKMLIELYTGWTVPIADIRQAMDIADDGVDDLAKDAGITLEAARLALTNEYGVPCTAVFARDLALDELLAYVRAGRLAIVFELHGDLSRRMDQGFRGLHAVLVTGVDGDQVEVKDPDRWGPTRADRWTVPIDELRRAWEDGAVLGGGAVIPNEARGGDMDRGQFNEWFKQQLEATVWPVVESMKTAYNPCVVYMRENGQLDAAQEAEIAAALARLDKLRDI